ncbi:MAG: DUF262 domain-containing protein [Candidatus Moeniiplasma glomeromycotorum]|nr:DUF262 domain-containing protein [Candidatus Moeniiplasma glomeromycotorum]MCE8167074.1 DUF262 domain-containing protein [Candidatus Moeniiplasma glomeromycotorum]MCE8168914.1 DUF262 domain-containing protein [Candidatus Moeniiplasma glomeromycotorum]
MKPFIFELSSFEKLFQDRKMVIPYYQRDYIWNEENWEKWLNDIRELLKCEDAEEFHFIGSIICQKRPKTDSLFPEYLIIDGQQRITTFFCFCLSILEILEKNTSKPSLLTEKIYQLLFVSDKNEPRLFMRGEDEKSLEAVIYHKNSETNEQRISKTHEYFKKKLGTNVVEKHLKDYFEKLKSKFKFISIDLKEEDDALEIFKSINTSGIMLTSVDLIKAEFFITYERKGLSSDCKKLSEEWEDIKIRVGKENMDHFFYIFLLSKHRQQGEYSREEFYTFFRDKLIRVGKDIQQLWNEIVQKSKIYSQIINPQLDYWGKDFYLPVLEAKVLNLDRIYPLVIVLKEKGLQGKKEASILKRLITYAFRIKTKRITFQQSEVFRWIRLVQNDQLDSILNDLNILKEIERSDDFWVELEQKFLKESEIKWLLTRFYLTILPEGFFISSLQLEHMFPKKPDKEQWRIPEWKELEEDKKKVKEKLNSLGNATLLNSNQNISASNKVWKLKREEFKKKTCLQHEKNELDLLNKLVFLPEDIDKRKKWLIQQFKESGILFIDERKERSQLTS